jgi:hypothetical protein
MLAVAKRLGRGSTTATQEDPFLTGDVMQIAVTVTQVQLREIPSDEIRSILGRNNLDSHSGAFLPITASVVTHRTMDWEQVSRSAELAQVYATGHSLRLHGDPAWMRTNDGTSHRTF